MRISHANTSHRLVSIITPSFNCIDTIYQTYLSICNQTHTTWEWLVTDDCSSDGSYEFFSKISSSDSRIKLFRNRTNQGAAVSRNVSISNASGEYIAFIDSDDIWLEDKLEKQLLFMEGNNTSFSFTAYELIDGDGNSLNQTVDTHLKGAVTYEDMLRKKATLGCSTVMIKNNYFSDLKMPLIRTGQDYALWLKLLKSGESAHPIPELLTKYRILPNSISRNKLKKAQRQWQIYRDIEKLPLPTAIECFFFYAFRAVFRK
ncbi:glycosyltransferase family 2 protein [Vibrio diazotrophicus]|uniref:glycosyltransferase family 2 protein n=1 Tax=Vibrio diazotrophicus TaxID=685 RepID=UPI00142E4C0A|nr:glycosyltransferase family 2 protein [Vibrio diazotrophicus]NIY92601.1 glycosyltransferase family 2 protein [Vibrio diazotrophicus]